MIVHTVKSMKTPLLMALVMLCLTAIGCSKDDPLVVTVTVNGSVLFDDGDDFNGDIDASFVGDGGSVTRTFMWQNSKNTADYNADITATANGAFRMIVEDADGNVVLDKSLNGASEPDSFSGVTTSGTSGIWSVIITITSFNGDGSFSLSEGD